MGLVPQLAHCGDQTWPCRHDGCPGRRGAALRQAARLRESPCRPRGRQRFPGKEAAIALFLACGALELGVWTDDEEKEPGNFGDPLGLNQYTPDMRAREINNGRFAMFAAIGIISAELLTGKDAIEQF